MKSLKRKSEAKLLVEDSYDSEESNSQIVTCDDAEDVPVKIDAFSDIFSKILSQSVEENKDPILSKRKTEMMKNTELEKNEKEILKRNRKNKKIELEKQMVIPDVATVNYERQLKRLANKGGQRYHMLATQLRND